jgi:hypothetical protein
VHAFFTGDFSLNVKVKCAIACFLVLIILFSFAQMSMPNRVEAAQGDVVDRAYWLRLAKNAWQYFQPGVGVNSATGLHSAGLGYHYFTGWDLAVYVTAVLDAQQLGLISKAGAWGADYRIDKVVSWLQTMQLTSENLPYTWYDSDTGLPALGLSTLGINIYDYGYLLIALYRLQICRPDLAGAIGSLVQTRFNSSFLASQVVPSFCQWDYNYFIAHGFEHFGYGNCSQVSEALNLLNSSQSQAKVTVYGVQLPKISLMCEPLLLSTFNLDPDPIVSKLMQGVYLAHEGRYNATGKWTAMSEGNTGLNSPSYVYELTTTSDGDSWVTSPTPITPIAYFKVAISFLALFNTTFARGMVSYLEPHLLTNTGLLTVSTGYMDGVDESGRVVTMITDKTNGLILNAAKYAIERNTPSIPSSSPTISASLNSSLSPGPSSSTSNGASLSPTPTNSPVVKPMIDPLMIVSVVAVVCFFLFFSMLVRSKRNGSGSSLNKLNLQVGQFETS